MDSVLNFCKRPELFTGITFLSICLFPFYFGVLMTAITCLRNDLQIITERQTDALTALLVFQPFYTFALMLLSPICSAIVAVVSYVLAILLCIYTQRKWAAARHALTNQ